MEQLIRDLHDPANQSSPERINEIQKQIQRLQRDKAAWQSGLDLLNHAEALLRFYGALTLTIKINADWDNDGLANDEPMKAHLIEALVGSYVRLVELPDANFVLRKLSSTLVTLFARSDSAWSFPLRHVFACILNGSYVPEETAPTMEYLLEASTTRSFNQLKGPVLVATIMAEDLIDQTYSTVHEGNLARRVGSSCLDAWQLFRCCIARAIAEERSLNHHDAVGNSQTQSSKPESTGEIFELLQLVLKAIPYWTSMLKYHSDTNTIRRIEAIARECIEVATKYLEHEPFTGTVLQMLISLGNSGSSWNVLREALPNFPASVANSHKVKEMVDLLLRGNPSADSVLFLDLLEATMCHVDITKPDFLHDHRYNEVIRTLQRLLRCDGIAIIEDPACQVALERISEIVEGYTDWEDIHDPAQAALKALAADACDACLQKIKIPPEQISSETSDWDADDRSKFQDFRYDVQDFLQSAFTILGNDLIEEIVKTTILVHGASPDWSTFEAGTFSLNAFSDTMSSDPEMYDGLITAVFGSPAWTSLLQSVAVVPDKAVQTGIRFIAENVGYLQRFPERLVVTLNFLFSSLHLHASASAAASKAIYSLCDSHREYLREGLPQFMQSLSTIGDIGEVERHRIYAAVAAIIQALPSDAAKVQPVSHLLASVNNDLTSSTPLTSLNHDYDNSHTEFDDTHLRACISVMQTLAAVGKGLRSPADGPVDLEATAPASPSADFWTNGPGWDVQREALRVYETTTSLIKSHNVVDGVFTDACCDFIKSGFTEAHPSPFKFADSVALVLISELTTLDNPSMESTMACASSFLASIHDPTSRDTAVAYLVHSVVSLQQRILSTLSQQQTTDATDFLPSSLDFLTRLLSKSGSTWFGLQDSQSTAAVSMEMALWMLKESDTLPRRSAAAFFAAFVDFVGLDGITMLDRASRERVNSILQAFAPRILSTLVHLIGGECARSELDSLTEMLKKFVQKQAMLTKAVLREAVKLESGVMSEKSLKATTIEHRNRFVAQVEALRGQRKTNEVVKDFWIACKGSGFGYIG